MKTTTALLRALAFAWLTAACLIPLTSKAGSATWDMNPASNDWDTAGNWTPATVPNGGSDVATFDASTTVALSLSAPVVLDSIVFDPGAPSYLITCPGMGYNPQLTLTFEGAGVINNSGKVQNFVAGSNGTGSANIYFENNATAGTLTSYEAQPNGDEGVLYGGLISFDGASDAGSAAFQIDGAGDTVTEAGWMIFDGSSSAKSATFTIIGDKTFPLGGQVTFGGEATADQAIFNLTTPSFPDSFGLVFFEGEATAGQATFNIQAGQITFYNESSAGSATFLYQPKSVGAIFFRNHSTAGHARFTIYGSPKSDFGQMTFTGSAHAGESMVTLNGTSKSGSAGSKVLFQENAHADTATFVVNGGTNGGAGSIVDFSDDSRGVQSTMQIFGNGNLNVTDHQPPGVEIGSLEGDGTVSLGANRLTVGTNNRDTVFSGVITDGGQNGSLTKTGSGQLQLTGANTYGGGAVVEGGILSVANGTGSATGTGAVAVNTGVLAGSGIVGGAGIIGTGNGSGAFLAPAGGTSTPATLTIQKALTFDADATYTCALQSSKKKPANDEVVANGVTIASGAQFNLLAKVQGKLKAGTSFTVISNTASTPISGTFANLADGAILTVGNTKLRASYEGGDGNDLTLTVVP